MKNIYIFFIAAWITLISLPGFSQINQGGLPFSFQNTQLVKSNIPVVQMPGIDLPRLMREDSINDPLKDIPWRFGENLFVNFNLNNSGTWDILPQGDKLWRLAIRCQGAFTINLTFDNYHLPPGASLFVYNADKSQVIGAFTDFNNREDKVFATTLVKGEEITIEYYEPSNPVFRGELNIYRVTHGYRDAYGYAKSFGGSGSCENNVACPESAGWENQIKSVCMLVSGGSGFCSGAIVNNTSQNGVPYILTANHCYSDPSSWVFWFNWQSPTCANPGSSPAYNSISGATLKARNASSDFCLVQMSSTPPSSYNVYYAGWNRQNVAATSGAGIHHPAGDIKKISFSTTPYTSDTYSGTPADSHWKVIWSDGVTEGGSSGSPIFDQNHRIVGQLHGGPSVCGGGSLWDFYGKVSMSWDYGTTSATRLKDWLDPTNISGNTLDGWDPNAVSPTLSVTPADRPVTPPAGSTTFSVTSNSSWTATSSQGWCTVTPSGSGSGTITATYSLNNSASSRVANITVTVTGLTPVVVTVTQAAPTLSVTPADQPVSYPSGNTSFSVTSNSSWTASSSQGWCTVTPSGTGSGTITATYLANSLIVSRVANITVTVAGLTPVVVTVTQAGTPPTLSVSPADRPVTPAAGNTSFTVTSNTAWSVSSNQSWCTVTPSGSGNGTITANYSVNNTSLARVATITVTVSGLSPVTVTITQAAPTLSVSPANQPVAYSAGNTSFTVTSNTNWSASSDQLWCTVTSSGSGNGTITANYTANPTYVVRVANVTVNVPGLSSVIVTVTQAAAPPAELNYTIVNDVQTSDRTLEFDLFLLDTQPATPLELSMIQTGILVSNTIINGGTISTSIVPGSSQLVSAEQPNAISWVTGSPNGCIKIAARAIPGCGNGTIISTSGSGTKICRVKITNSVPFTSGSQANLAFNFAGVPFLTTKVYQYLSCTSTQMTTNTSNCFSLAANPILNGPPSLSVSPSDRPVTASAGNTSFAVTSNAAWTASSDQLWCSVTPSGFGSATILANYTENTSASPRVATITVSVAGLSPILVTVSQAGVPFKTLNLSSLFLEGLYNGYGTMFQAQDAVYDEFGNITGVIPKWTDGSADHIAVELHSSAWRFDPACSCDTSDYPTIVYAATNVPLTTTGTATLSVPAENNGAYYLTIRHRNSIETTSALPVDFSGATINYAFTPASQAFDANMTTMIEVDETVSPPLIFAGDVNQDGQVEAEDLNLVGNDASIFAYGYLSTDVFGDGMIEAQDLNISGNNAATFVYKHVPQF